MHKYSSNSLSTDRTDTFAHDSSTVVTPPVRCGRILVEGADYVAWEKTEKFKSKCSMCEREVNGKMITDVLLQESHVTEKERQELGENHVHMWLLKLLPSMIPDSIWAEGRRGAWGWEASLQERNF